MNNPFDQIRLAMQSAKEQLRAADEAATDMAQTLAGRLRKVRSNDALVKLKKELRHYNAHTREWKE